MHAAVDGPERGQQTAPRIVAAFEDFFAMLVGRLPQLLADGGEGVVVAIELILDGEQFPLFGTEHDDQSHHDRQSGFIEVGFGDGGKEFVVVVLIGPVEGLHQHFDAWRT